MKIALITIHYANSYGGCLQALASQQVLSKYGEVSIIDYRNPEIEKTLDVVRFGLSARSFLRVAKDICRFLPRKRLINNFKRFIFDNYSLTSVCRTEKQLSELNEKFDIFVCGSDQIWNPNIIGKLDTNYMLSFANKNKKKISFSSSFGSYEYKGDEIKCVKKELSSFHSVSLREKDAAEKISTILGRLDVENTIDPTLMLTKNDWIDLLKIKKTNADTKYILVYTLKKNDFTRKIIDQLSAKLNYKVISIDQDPYLGYRADAHIMDASPSKYVDLIANASFVITNSFHGTAFAVNFGIPFLSIKPESGTNRILGLLNKLGLENQLIQNDDDFNRALNSSISFNVVESRLDELRKETRNYLDKAFLN